MNAIITSAVWGVVMMFGGLFLKRGGAIANLAIAGVAVLLFMNVQELGSQHYFAFDTKGMLSVEVFGLLFNAVCIGSCLIFFLLSSRDIVAVGENPAEYFALMFFVLCGVSISCTFNNLLMMFVGIEIMSIPLYILTGSRKRDLKSNEASLKYFLMGSFATGIMLLGIALLYGGSEKGSFFVSDLAQGHGVEAWSAAGLILVMVSLAFKVSAAPFHFWTPDVYDGAPTVFTSFMATIVKGGAFIAFIRLFHNAFEGVQPHWQLLIAIITAATLFVGNITAVFQQSVKRMLAYSSIAQVGFMLFSVLTLNTLAQEGIILYTAAYSLATIGIFAILARMHDHSFDGFNGMGRRYPLLSAVNTIFLLSLAGIPLTAGFFAKYYMIASAIQTRQYLWLVIFGLLCAAVSVYYYFRVIQAMYFKDGEGQTIEAGIGFKSLLVIVAAAVILLGIFPQWLIDRLYIIYL